jgi:cytochrome c2
MPRVATLATLLALGAFGALGAGCRRSADMQEEARLMTRGGEPTRGHALIQQYGCGSCHVIPGVRGANGSVGPSLAAFRERAYVGGVLPHTTENLLRWLQDPPAVDSLTAMPNLGVSERDARHIAAYLYALDR